MSALILPQWPQPPSVRSCATTRKGGISLPPYGSLNLGSHVGDEPELVSANRQRLIALGGLPAAPHWLEQIHGTDVVRLTSQTPLLPTLIADAAYTCEPGVVCAAMTADCLPVLFCSRSGDEVEQHMLAGADCVRVCWKTRLRNLKPHLNRSWHGWDRRSALLILKWVAKCVKPLLLQTLLHQRLLHLQVPNSWPTFTNSHGCACKVRASPPSTAVSIALCLTTPNFTLIDVTGSPDARPV